MTRTFFFIVLTGVCHTKSIGQTLFAKVGATYSELEWLVRSPLSEKKLDNAPVIGYALGIGVEYFNKGLFSVSSEATFYRSGGKFTEKAVMDFGQYSEVIIDYSSFGFLANINPLRSKTKLQLQIGPRIDFMLSRSKQPLLDDFDKFNALSKVNCGITCGVGLYRKIGKIELGVSGYWLNHLKNLVEWDAGNTPAFVDRVRAKERICLMQFVFRLPCGR
ncbi:MAG: outer membrane beta-barrel protein [Saprospiraceae bacterium]|nr:outer membrane beta-barrel protein [Saprospiraceae bacterium]